MEVPHGPAVGDFPVTGAKSSMYFTDRGIEELVDRRGDEEVSVGWLAERLREFVDLNPEFEIPVERLATWLARLDEDD
ncbi:hypothetical protein ABH927_003797 [Planotetraspora sp. GP83]